METHKNLEVWKMAILLVSEIYQITANLPKNEEYGLSSQMKRASISIPANIAEGAARNYPKEYIRFVYIALASLSELETLLIISQELGLSEPNKSIDEHLILLRKKLYKFVGYLKRNPTN